jgi:8-oxo-dGTP diphosphatase
MKVIDRVTVAIENNGNFLILRRTGKTENNSEVAMERMRLWEFPGGTVKDNEDFETSAKREIMEECGLRIESFKYIGEFERISDKKFVTVHLYHCDGFSNEIKLSKEHDDFKWVKKEDILKMKPSREIGIDTIAFFNKAKEKDNFPVILQKFVNSVKSDNELSCVKSIMVVGSYPRDEYVNVWSDLDVVIFIRNGGGPIRKEILDKLNKKAYDCLDNNNIQLWLKIHTEDTFPYSFAEDTVINYFTDGKILYGEDIKELLKKRMEGITIQNLIDVSVGKIADARFFSRYYFTSINEVNKELGTIHIDRCKDDSKKMRAAQIIDRVIDIAQLSLFIKGYRISSKKKAAIKFSEVFSDYPEMRDIPLQMVAIRSNWLNIDSNDLDTVFEKGIFFAENFGTEILHQYGLKGKLT